MKDNNLITLEQVKSVLERNKSTIDIVKQFVGPTSMREVYTRLGVSWSSLSLALQSAQVGKRPPKKDSGGRPLRSGKMSGAAAHQVLSRNMGEDLNRTPRDIAEALRAAADLLERQE